MDLLLRFVLNAVGNDGEYVDSCDTVASTNDREDWEENDSLVGKCFVETG